ncbi:hypothetical protein [Streptomyces purpureus]|uniref:hypothetical protein n=1 Tax=Streptomyces purpureus TaxID=1951 RepID=UPI001319DCE3|nr:hypothetical protein [Streptomyces purpureus]
MTTGCTHGQRDGTGRGVVRALADRRPTWLALALVVVTFVDGAPPAGLLAALLAFMPLCYLAFGAVRGELRRPGVLALQAAGLPAFGALALVALAVDQKAGLYVLAGGWLAHGVWDFAHLRAGRVVPRAWSEWCGVVDLFGAAAILLWA